MTDTGFAGYFKKVQGCEIIPPPLDVAEFGGTMWQLESTPAFEKRLAAAMVRTYQRRRRPDLPPDMIDAFDKSIAYRSYVDLIKDILQGRDVSGMSLSSSWARIVSRLSHRSILVQRLDPYRMAKNLFWSLPGPLRESMNGLRHHLVRLWRTRRTTVSQGIDPDMAWAVFHSQVLDSPGPVDANLCV